MKTKRQLTVENGILRRALVKIVEMEKPLNQGREMWRLARKTLVLLKYSALILLCGCNIVNGIEKKKALPPPMPARFEMESQASIADTLIVPVEPRTVTLSWDSYHAMPTQGKVFKIYRAPDLQSAFVECGEVAAPPFTVAMIGNQAFFKVREVDIAESETLEVNLTVTP